MERFKLIAEKLEEDHSLKSINFRNYFSSLLNIFRYNPNNIAPSIDLLYPNKSKEEKPAIIIVPGGGYLGRDKIKEGIQIADFFHKNGFVPFILNYRVSPFTFPSPLYDGINAIKFIRKNSKKFSIDSNRIGMIGFSAGGHIVSNLSAQILDNSPNCKVNFQILCYPLIDLEENNIKNKFVRALIHNKKEFNYLLDTSKSIPQNTSPTFIWHSKNDIIVHRSHSIKYANIAKEHHKDVEFKFYKNGRHGIGLALSREFKNTDIKNWSVECIQWLKRIKIIQNN